MPMTPRNERPCQRTVWYGGVPYTLDLVRCRRALVMAEVEGIVSSLNTLALTCGVSRSTASRFFSGRGTSLGVTLRILGCLKVRFEEVATATEAAGPDDG